MGFIDSFFGNSSGNEDRRLGEQQARHLREVGLNRYTNTLGDYLDQTMGYINPIIEQGQQSNSLLADFLNLNGQEAQQTAYNNYSEGPAWEFELNNRIDALDRSATSRGQLFSGRQMEAVADEGQKFQRGVLNDYLNRLTQQGQQGQQASSQGANYTYNTGQNIGNAQFGVSQQNAAGAQSLQNFIADTRGSGAQGLLNFAGTAAKAYAGMPGAQFGGFA